MPCTSHAISLGSHAERYLTTGEPVPRQLLDAALSSDDSRVSCGMSKGNLPPIPSPPPPPPPPPPPLRARASSLQPFQQQVRGPHGLVYGHAAASPHRARQPADVREPRPPASAVRLRGWRVHLQILPGVARAGAGWQARAAAQGVAMPMRSGARRVGRADRPSRAGPGGLGERSRSLWTLL